MARFNMETKLVVTDIAGATAAAASTKAAHHKTMLEELIKVNDASNPVSCKELCAWMEENKGCLTEDQRKPWDKYSDACHMAYFVNRYKKYVTATDPATVVAAPATPAVEAPVVEAPAAVVEEPAVTA